IPITIGISVLAFALFLKSNVAKRTQLLYEYVAQQIDFLTTLTGGRETEDINFNSDIEYLL
ncbi:MAG: hypothetical protein NC918_07710, partial [Candidatus Omnitrophica bacterium]|nr:hypothetical protein [Candidatus Omnitrophota bacterium]